MAAVNASGLGIALTPYWLSPVKPLWSLTGGAAAEPAYYSHVAASGAAPPTNPWGGDWIQIDETVASGAVQYSFANMGAGAGSSFPPDAMKRYGYRLTFLWAKGGNVAAQEPIMNVFSTALQIVENSDQTLQILDTPNVGGPTISAKTASTYSTGTVYLIELSSLQVYGGATAGAGGNRIHHTVLRTFSVGAAGNPPTLIDTVHAYMRDQISATAIGLPFTASSGRKSWYAHIVVTGEDLDNLFGAPRVAWYQPAANGAENTNWSNNTAQWLEVPPDGSTSTRQCNVSNAKATSTTAAGAGSTSPGVGDTIIGAAVFVNGAVQSSKGVVGHVNHMICDGNTAHELIGPAPDMTSANSGGTYNGSGVYFFQNPSGATWAQTDIASLQIGCQGVFDTGSPTMFMSSVQGFVSWVKSGETMTAVPGPDTLPPDYLMTADTQVAQRWDVGDY